jgi:VanZ family protein
MMKRSTPRLLINGVITLGLLCFIWGNSLLPGKDSGELSGFVGMLLQKLLPFLNLQSETGMHFLRKAAHFSEFAALGMSFTWLFGMLSGKKAWALSLPLICGAAAAAIDETIQRFVPDRGPSIFDVGIDTAGVAFGIGLLLLIHFIRKKKH